LALVGISVVLVGVTSYGCGRSNVASEPPDSGPPAASQAPLTADEAPDTAHVFGVLYPLVCAAHQAEWSWATCADEAIGFEKVLRCAEDASAKAETARAALTPGKVGASACGGQVEDASRTLIEMASKLLRDQVQWLKANKGKLSGRLATKPIVEVCRAIACPAWPRATADEYKGVSMLTVNTLACVEAAFRCGDDPSERCPTTKVVPRLGVGCPDGAGKRPTVPAARLFSRASGQAFPPLR
jgi:hypothetical protein